jgi:DNA polymerase-4
MQREILYLKVPSFPVAAEQLRDASLRGRPVAISTNGPGRSLLQAVSPEARREGLYKGMLQQEALRSCPDVRLLPPNPELYVRLTRRLFGLLSAYTPLVEPTRPGSLFLDLSGTRRLFGPSRDLAWKIRKEIRERAGLEPRLGLAANKLLSRIATRVIPASGLCDVFPGGERHFLEPLDVTVLPALYTHVHTDRVRELNIEKVSHLLPIQLPALQLAFGRQGLALYRQARGLDVSPVRPPSGSPRITEEETLPEESNEDALLAAVLQGLAEEAGRRLRQMKATAGRVELEIQYADTVLARRACRLRPPTHLDAPLFQSAYRLLELAARRRVRIRRITIHCTQIAVQPLQATLFPDDMLFSLSWRQEALQHALDEIRSRYGKEAIQKGQGQRAKDKGQRGRPRAQTKGKQYG